MRITEAYVWVVYKFNTQWACATDGHGLEPWAAATVDVGACAIMSAGPTLRHMAGAAGAATRAAMPNAMNPGGGRHRSCVDP